AQRGGGEARRHSGHDRQGGGAPAPCRGAMMVLDANGLTAGFWSAAARRELVRPVCRDCGRSFFTPQIACPRCLSENWAYETSCGRGVVYSSTTVHKAPSPDFSVPFGLG